MFGSALSSTLNTLEGFGGQSYEDPYLASGFDGGSIWDRIFKTAGSRAQVSQPNTTRPNQGSNGDSKGLINAQTTIDERGNPFAWMDLDKDQVFDTGEEYDPTSSVWNDWMQTRSGQSGIPTSAGIGYVPQTREQQDYQNAVTLGEYLGDPLTQAERDQYASIATPKKTWKTEMAAGNDWLGDLF